EHFDLSRSRSPEGITTSRYPSALDQYIPPFSLIWVAMVHDFWMLRDDPDYVRGFLPGIRGVLDWFAQRIDDSGLLGPIPQWPYVDWARGWRRGVPPGGTEGHSVVISLQFAYALERAAELHLARCLAVEGAPHQIRVNTVNPDAVLQGSRIWKGAWRKERAEAYGLAEDELEEHYRRRSLLQRSVRPEDVAEAVYFFCADLSSRCTGNILNVDAGVVASFPR
ncbi:MAG: SDR family oxidoreductase, partial [Acidobacteriota bacterium]